MMTFEGLTSQSADILDRSMIDSVGNKLMEILNMQYGSAILNLSKDFSSMKPVIPRLKTRDEYSIG